MASVDGGIDPVTVVSLADRPDLLPVVARWQWREWGEEAGRVSEEQWREVVARRNEPDAVPFTLVAFLGPVPVGCVSVCRDDRDADFDAEGPWLSGMFVLGSARDLGVGRALVRAAEERAAAMGHRELWLHTAEAHRFYERCGWRVARVRSALGRDAVMCRELAAPGSG